MVLNPAHPLANDAMAILQGHVSPTAEPQGGRPGQQATTTKCPQCGGELHYEPGATEVVCPYCDHQVPLQQGNVLDGEARFVGDMRLKRRYQDRTWAEVGRIVHCQSCGAELAMSHRLSQQCIFCGSTNVLVEDNEYMLEQPDGFLPFAISEEQATEAIQEAQRSGLRRLKTWLVGKGKEQKVWNLQGVYVLTFTHNFFACS